MRSSIKLFIQSILGRRGYKLTRVGPGSTEGLTPFFSMLKGRGFNPKHIIDVGANRGYWTRAAIRFFPEAQYTLVEPQDFLKTYVQDLIDAGHKIRWVNAGVSDSPSKLQFTLSNRDDSSTFTLSKDQAQAAGLRQILVDVKTLNEISRDSGAPPPEMVKIDAEGLDLRALKGASDLFGHTDIFLVEVAIFDSTAENTLENVTRFMNESGYRLLDITDLNRSPKYGVLWLSELAFLRRSSPLLESVSSYE
jgi:FkbM family methyltransferase